MFFKGRNALIISKTFNWLMMFIKCNHFFVMHFFFYYLFPSQKQELSIK
jgi:hypothetical protein